MQTFVEDTQIVGNTTSTLFTMPQQGAVTGSVILNNIGTATINYDFQQSPDNVNWTDIAPMGSPTNNTVQPGYQVQILVQASYSWVRCTGNASGGSTLEFSITRFYNRPSGGACPLIAGF